MELILPYLLKVVIFIVSFGAVAFFFRNYLRRKRGAAELFDVEVLFVAGLAAAVITMIVKRGLFKLIF